MSTALDSKTSRWLSVIGASYAVAGGAVSFAGWWLGIYAFTDWAGSGITIKPNAAIAVTLSGLALLTAVLLPSARKFVKVIGLVTAALGAMTIFEHLTSIDLRIDTLIFDEPTGARATAAPGRMGPPAAFSFLGIGIGLVAMTGSARSRGLSVALALTVLTIGTLSLTGYMYGAQEMYTIPRATGIALQTASMLLALSIGIITALPDRQPMATLCEDSSAGVIARRIVPLALGLPIILGWLRLEGQRHGLYEVAFGTALRSVGEALILLSLLWGTLRAIRHRDIAQRRAQQELRASERQLSETLASITDGFLALDRHWRFTFVNAEAERLLQQPRSNLLGRIIWELFPEAAGSALYVQFHRAVREDAMIEVEGPGLAQESRLFSNRAYPTADGGLSVYFQDVTERKRTEDALKEADRRKDHFLATLAHELRNPLAPIRNATRMLLNHALPEATRQRGVEIIHRQVQHMARLLDDLLDVSRIARNRLEIRRDWVDLGPIIANAVEASRPLVDAAGHDLRVEIPEQPVYVNADGVRLTQVISNLLNNSAKYTVAPGRIRLAVSCPSADVEIRVEDDGIGIAKDMLPRVFDMFAQSPAALSKAQGGLGIGLALARGVIDLHGGSIEAESDGEGRGSTFIVRLPRLMGLSTDAKVPKFEDLHSAAPRRVLVVDDLHDSADTLSMLLMAQGHHVRTAYGGQAALEALAVELPDVIFLDLGMPQIDGYEVCRRIRQTPGGGQVLVVAVSGWGQAGDRARTAAAAFDHHFIKPVDPNAVSSLLAAFSSKKS
jgi:signal transduction histidine kinase/ActR/RegA family two-component response regulator